jgi:hypothetical protein
VLCCAARQVSALQSALDRSQAAEATLTARLTELGSQLNTSSLEGGSLRAQNGELLAELAALRCVGWRTCRVGSVWVHVLSKVEAGQAGLRSSGHP